MIFLCSPAGIKKIKDGAAHSKTESHDLMRTQVYVAVDQHASPNHAAYHGISERN